MAGNVNKVFLMGNLTRDIEMRQLPSGMPVGNFGLAVSERYKDKNEQWQEKANFIDCEIFGRRAEVMQQYLGKGKPVFIEGKLRLDQWQDQQGNNRSKLKVVVEDFQFVESKGGQGQQQDQNEPVFVETGRRTNDGYSGQPQKQQQMSYDPPPSVNEDDIPF